VIRRPALGGLKRAADALELTAMIALRDYDRGRRAGARWLQRWLDETPSVTIDEAVMVAGCLVALGGPAPRAGARRSSGHGRKSH
jgi:hypothetical protein